MKKGFLFLLCIMATACSKQTKELQVTEEKKGFNLEKVSFKEDPLQFLKGKIDSTQNVDTDFVRNGYSENFDYPSGYKYEPWNGNESLYGKAYYSTENDSMAYYKGIYFSRVAFLTRNNNVVAVLAYGKVPKEELYTNLKNQLQDEFGEPSFSPQTDQDVFYEFSAGDRYIQMDYSTGSEVTVSSDAPMKTETYYTIKMLVFNKAAADEIKKIQDTNYKKTGDYKVLPGDFQLYKQDLRSNILMMNEIYDKTYNP